MDKGAIMSRRATQQDFNDFYESLTPEQYKIVKEADELWADFFEVRLAEEPKGMTLEEMENKIKATRCN